jgi:hypothetical protein
MAADKQRANCAAHQQFRACAGCELMCAAFEWLSRILACSVLSSGVCWAQVCLQAGCLNWVSVVGSVMPALCLLCMPGLGHAMHPSQRCHLHLCHMRNKHACCFVDSLRCSHLYTYATVCSGGSAATRFGSKAHSMTSRL